MPLITFPNVANPCSLDFYQSGLLFGTSRIYKHTFSFDKMTKIHGCNWYIYDRTTETCL